MVQTFIKRPTSPLHYEPLYIPPEQILYPGSDEEATPDEREKKRRRVEIQGQQYLNGRPLFIQSAGLRGPFEKRWVNPWRSKERKYGVDDIRRFPQAGTEVFPRHSPVESDPITANRLAKTDLHAGAMDLVNDLPSNVRERSLSKTDTITKNGYHEVKRLSQQAARWAEVVDGQLQAKKLSEEAVARAIKKDQKTPSRLTPYVSEAVLGNDAASSAAFRAIKAPKPKPSPYAVPSSTYQPEFQYHQARKGTSISTSPLRAPFVDAPEQPQARLRSRSSSSSGSSAFAEALEAAQERAAPKSFSSSKSSSPAIDGRDTKSVRNRRVMRRLTFTPSGGAKVAPVRTSKPSSMSSAGGPAKTDMEYQDKPPSGDPPSLPRTSTKSSARSRNSIVFPEAQTDPIAHPPLAQAPSGPSTDFLETNKQSPKVPGLDEDDSYLDLSTQAAVLKAQRSFQAEVITALTPHPLKKEGSSPTGFTSRKAEITSMSHGSREAEAANAQLLKSSDSDEEPMSTQAMVDAISPFALTTIKKRPSAVQKRSILPSPTKKREARYPPPNLSPESPTAALFRSHSPGMSTSPSSTPSPSPSPVKSLPPIPLSHPTTNSKPQSSLTSFSILPNGTLTETSVYQQDGQQQQDIPNYDISLPLNSFDFDDTAGQRQANAWDLSAAIEEAGSFLGEWDLEAEARKEGSRSRRRESGNRTVLRGGT